MPSPKVATYDLQPEMSAPEVTDELVSAISAGTYDLIVANYANGDMVGHTGVLDAAKIAVETVDKSLGRLESFELFSERLEDFKDSETDNIFDRKRRFVLDPKL